MIALLPSEIARLILNYLEEEKLTKTYETFLDECRYLEECKLYLKRGIIVPKTIHGKTLSDYLVIDPKLSEQDKMRQSVSVGTQTDTIEKNSALVECNLFADQSMSSKRKLSQPDDKFECQIAELDQESITSSIENYSPSDFESNPSAKKKRLLIGKNVEKIPELTFSTIERSLDAFISDAANNFCQFKENKNQESAQKAETAKLDPKNNLKLLNTQNFVQQSPMRQNQPILFDLVTGRASGLSNNQMFTQSQQAPLVIVPSNIESPGVQRIQPIQQKESAKNIQPIVIDPFQKVHLTNAINLAGQVLDPGLNAKSNQTKIVNIKPKADTKIDDAPAEIFPKKKKVYNRVTPTIRAIYEKEQQNKEESQHKSSDGETKQDDGEAKDVHDEIGDIFDMSCTKANFNRSDSSDINLDDICMRPNVKSSQEVMRGKKINRIKKNTGRKEDDEVDNLDEKNLINNDTLTSTRTLRSRTNSQRKNF